MTNLTKFLSWGFLTAATVTTVLAFTASRPPRQPVKALQETPAAEVVLVEKVTATKPEKQVKKEFAMPKDKRPEQSGSRAHDESVKAEKTKKYKAKQKPNSQRSVQRSKKY
jgi:uncharacterized membrane protein YhiD involved in acid resistance